LDAYVFIREAKQGFLSELRRSPLPEVRFSTYLTGPYAALAIVTVGSLKELESLVLGPFREAGATSTETAISLQNGPLMLKYGPPAPVEAFVRIWVKPGRARDVLGAVSILETALGASIVAADFDILLELGGETFNDVRNTLLNEVHRIDGIRQTASSFART
jgi:DNA-binding Lrp family transcriptional regulator